MLVTIDRYRAITGDHTTPAVDVVDALADAVEVLEDKLDRPLDEAERTERMYPTRDGSLWPHAIPITVAAGQYIDGYRLISSGPFAWPSLVGATTAGIDVTYTGGWVERSANPDAVNRLPKCIEDDLAWAAHSIANPRTAPDVPLGATSVSLGDASVSYGPQGAVATAPAESRVRWSRRTLSYAYVRIGGQRC